MAHAPQHPRARARRTGGARRRAAARALARRRCRGDAGLPAKPGPRNVQRLTAAFQDGGDADPANDVIVVTLTLCGKAGRRSAYEISFDVQPPLFTDADRDGDGDVDRRDFCAQTRDAFAVLYGGPAPGGDGGIGEAVLVPGPGLEPDTVRVTVPVAALYPNPPPLDGTAEVYVWAETRRAGATSQAPFTRVPNRAVVDRLPMPDVRDGCARPQAADEVLLELPPGPASLLCLCTDNAEINLCTRLDCQSGAAQDDMCEPLCEPHGGLSGTSCINFDPVCSP